MDARSWGWDDRWEAVYRRMIEDGVAPREAVPGRVIADGRGLFRVAADPGVAWSRPIGRMWERIGGATGAPVTGDWALVETRPDADAWPMHALLPRRSALSRKSPTDIRHAAPEQVLAANVDLLLLVFGLDGGRNFTERALERYLAVAWQSGATPVVVLNKADLATDLDGVMFRARAAAPGAEVVATSSVADGGLDSLVPLLRPGATVTLVGRSGVGKSTIVNRLLGEDRLATQEIRAGDLRGRHTTSLRQMVRLATGALLIDTPGLRQIGLWGEAEAIDDSFAEIAELAEHCRFRDCAHHGEPGCAVEQALSDGTLDQERYESYLDLQRELAHLNRAGDVRARLEAKARGKALARHSRIWSKASGKRN